MKTSIFNNTPHLFGNNHILKSKNVLFVFYIRFGRNMLGAIRPCGDMDAGVPKGGRAPEQDGWILTELLFSFVFLFVCLV